MSTQSTQSVPMAMAIPVGSKQPVDDSPVDNTQSIPIATSVNPNQQIFYVIPKDSINTFLSQTDRQTFNQLLNTIKKYEVLVPILTTSNIVKSLPNGQHGGKLRKQRTRKRRAHAK